METMYDSAEHITDTWARLANELREITEEMSKNEDKLYSGVQPMKYLHEVFGCLRGLPGISKPIRNFEDILHSLQNASSRSGKDVKPRFVNSLQDYVDLHEIALGDVNELCKRLDRVLCTMEDCYGGYEHVDSEEADFYIKLNISIHKAKETFEKASAILKCLEDSSDYCEFLSEEGLSLDLRLALDCETFPVLRLLPDLGQKLLSVCSSCQDWLRSEGVYVETIQNEVGRLKSLVSRQEWKIRRTENQQKELFTALRAAQDEVGYDCEKQCDDIKRHLTEDSGCGLDPSSQSARLRTRLVDLETTVDEIQHLTKSLKSLARQKAREVDEYRELVHKLNENEQVLEKRNILLRSADSTDGCKASTEVSKHQGRRRSLESGTDDAIQDVVSRFKLSEQMRRRSLDDCRPIKLHTEKSHLITLDLTSPTVTTTQRQTKQRRLFSAELHRAFRIVKNNIGFGWKDLARSLPYWNGKRMSEIESDIAEIEYQHKGQLKEQAYQCLLLWYRYNGARATVTTLCETLRELGEIRLMEKIEDRENQSFLPDIRSN